MKLNADVLSVDVESVRRRLPVGDGQPATVIFCLIAGQSQAVVARRV